LRHADRPSDRGLPVLLLQQRTPGARAHPRRAGGGVREVL